MLKYNMKIFLILLIIAKLFCQNTTTPVVYLNNNIEKDLIDTRLPSSHIKVFMPSIPYTYISRLVNGTLFRVSANENGFEPMMAIKYEKINDLTYDIYLRKNVKFQDKSEFNANSVVENINEFIKHPFTYTDIHNRLKSVQKINDYKVRFCLKKPYSMFIRDLARINLYSHVYLQKYSWQGDITGDNMKYPGLYGLGPYVLKKGFATGQKQTDVIELEANEYYYEKNKPYIQKITIYTQLNIDEALDMAINHNDKLDITPIAFDKKIQVVDSKYTKLISAASTHNISIYFNLLNNNSPLQKLKIRKALNMAIDQKRLLHFVYKAEGQTSVTMASSNYEVIKQATKNMHYYGKNISQKQKNKLKKILNGLNLHVITQDRFMFLWKGIQYQLMQYGVKLHFHITSSEKDIYKSLFLNKTNPQKWDILTWGNDDWYGNHPWSAFLSYKTSSKWSAIKKDEKLQTYIQDLFDGNDFNKSVKNIVKRVYDKAYMLFVPSPNIVLAVNKEVSFTPSSIAIMPLWEAKITKYHWSINDGLCKTRELPMYPIKIKQCLPLK